MKHTSIEGEAIKDKCGCENISSIPFLNTQLSIVEGRIDVDLYKKRNRQKSLSPTLQLPQ